MQGTLRVFFNHCTLQGETMQKQFHILINPMRTSIFILTWMFFPAASSAADKTLIDYFQPTPIYDKLSTTAWGAAAVGPRDIHNGLEDKDGTGSVLCNVIIWKKYLFRTFNNSIVRILPFCILLKKL